MADEVSQTSAFTGKEEAKAAGSNDSGIHVDFMFGTADMSVVGVTHDGREITVFKDGNFVF